MTSLGLSLTWAVIQVTPVHSAGDALAFRRPTLGTRTRNSHRRDKHVGCRWHQRVQSTGMAVLGIQYGPLHGRFTGAPGLHEWEPPGCRH